MKRSMPLLLAALALTTLALMAPGGAVAADDPHGKDPYDMRFKFLGCSGDWPAYTPIRPIIALRHERGREVYHIKDPVDCGLRVRKPGYRLDGATLTLWYEVYADGPVAACFCEYNSDFSFKKLPAGLKPAFESRHTR